MPLPHDPTERSAVEEVSRAIAEASAAAGTDPDVVHSVCIGIPGYVDPGETGELFSEALPGWPVRGLKAILEAELARTVHIENDVNLAAVAEREHGAGVDSDVFALLWLGNGVGASFDVAGDLHRGCLRRRRRDRLPARSRWRRTRSTRVRDTAQDLVGGRAVALLARRHGLDVSGYHAARSALAEPRRRRGARGGVPRPRRARRARRAPPARDPRPRAPRARGADRPASAARRSPRRSAAASAA